MPALMASKTTPHCAECRSSVELEEDVDNPGTFYCRRCWEAYEADEPEAEATAPTIPQPKQSHPERVPADTARFPAVSPRQVMAGITATGPHGHCWRQCSDSRRRSSAPPYLRRSPAPEATGWKDQEADSAEPGPAMSTTQRDSGRTDPPRPTRPTETLSARPDRLGCFSAIRLQNGGSYRWKTAHHRGHEGRAVCFAASLGFVRTGPEFEDSAPSRRPRTTTKAMTSTSYGNQYGESAQESRPQKRGSQSVWVMHDNPQLDLRSKASWRRAVAPARP